MHESLYDVLPFVALATFLGAAILISAGRGLGTNMVWMVPAAFCALFLAWSFHALWQEGLAGVWVEHSRNAWGNQIWFDLLISLCVGWALLVPRARAVGMSPWPWLVLLVCTGGIGLLAMLARCLFLEHNIAIQTRRRK